jgi:hypothetical protein
MSAKHTAVEHQLLQRMAPMLLALESIVALLARGGLTHQALAQKKRRSVNPLS